MKCPCEDCITKAICQNKYTRVYFSELYLIVSLVERCPLILEYFGKERHGSISHYKQIYEICKVFNVKHNNFIWSLSYNVSTYT